MTSFFEQSSVASSVARGKATAGNSARIVSSPASTPATMSVSIRSPTMTVEEGRASRELRPSVIMSGFGLPT